MTGQKSGIPLDSAQGKSSAHRWPDWYSNLSAYRKSDNRRAVWQLINTLIPYGALWYLMILTRQRSYSYALTLLIAVPASAFLVRIFILFHDCVHGSLFRAGHANNFFGHLLGVLVFTPFQDWRFSHLRHHATYSNLDTRGFGDIWTLTRGEFESLPKTKQWAYRLYRNPVITIGLGALFMFLLRNRLPTRTSKRRERMSVILTNLLIVLVFLAAHRLIGWRTYIAIQFPIIWMAGAAGIWLFFVQHQFPNGYWARKGEWHPLRAAMEGASFYRLPTVLRWFTGNIGYHYIHHLNSRIPNYQLKKCYDSIPALQNKKPLTIAESLTCPRLKVWDEQQHKLVGFP